MHFKDEMIDMYNEQHSKEYRNGDESAIQYGSRKHYCNLLQEISVSFDYKISVLDVGCGTGRYFHCLRNVKKLIGLDISFHMLKQALNPVKKKEIDVANLELLCGDIFNISISSQFFDFIYSIGVLGEYSPFNPYICNKLFDLLKPYGKLFITIVDINSRMQHLENELPNLKRRILAKTFPFLPSKIKKYFNRNLSSLYMTDKEIIDILKRSAFTKHEISKYKNPTGSGWQGTHYDCLAFK